MTDRELLELAAKAAGTVYQHETIKHHEDGGPVFLCPFNGFDYQWDPLVSDEDAFRLAVKLRLSISRTHCECCIAVSDHDNVDWLEKIDGDEYAATRRAIVRAAAEIGRTK